MPFYQKLGQIPRKHHIWFHRNGAAPSYKNEGIAYEHVFTTQGFDEAYSIMYHLRPPTRVRNVELVKQWEPKKVTDSPLRHHHLKTANIPRRGDLYTGRVPMLFNQDVIAYRARPAKAYDRFEYYKNGGADEIIFVFHGGGVMESVFGKLPYRAEDYIVIPRGITYRLVPDKVEEEDYLILESVGPVRIPQRYLNHEGQIKMGAPYSERDLHAPTELITIDKEEDVDVLVKDGPRWTHVTMAHHPFDAVGWDGYLYPFTFNAQDFEPITGTVHQPPPIHQTFEIRGYVVCTFAPRMLDTHPEAVKIPWVHDNVEADEVLFYVRGNFGSRRGIESGSITLHPRGIPHGHAELNVEERFTRESNRLPERDLDRIANAYRDLLQSVGEDVDREGLQRTPDRAARALEFLTQGYRQNLKEIINRAVFESSASEIILVKDIELYSLCEHHLLPFIGRAHVAYLPNGKVIGLSKVARIVDVFARRLQIQENLTTQIAESLMNCLQPSGVAVVVEAKHLCMMMRGVEKQNSVMKTSCLLGTFKEDARTRSEFLSLLKD